MTQMNPLPFPYYRNMVLLLLVFEVVVAFKIALGGFTPLGLDAKVRGIDILPANSTQVRPGL